MSKNSNVKRDDVKQRWEGGGEEVSFPLVCETCLGDNPYVRMTCEKFGKKCRVCDVPFTVFAWQAGSKGRLKKVEICHSCAKLKNVCQVCIFDLQYGLPVGVRDSILAQDDTTTTCTSVANAMIPMSDANRSWYNAQQQQQQQQPSISVKAALKLQSMARMEPRYERNLPKLCSFFARGECNRGSHCPFRHEISAIKDRNDPLSKQNTKDRFYGSSDPVAQKMISAKKAKDEERRQSLQSKNNVEERCPTTLLVQFTTTTTTNNTSISEADVRDAMYSHGEIVRVQVLKGHAFVEYTTEQAAQLAKVNVKSIQNIPVIIKWARQPKRGVTSSTTQVEPLTSNQPIPSHSFQPSTQLLSKVAAAPGGGPIKNNKRNAAPTIQHRPTPYTKNQTHYPSTDPSRLGTRNHTTTSN